MSFQGCGFYEVGVGVEQSDAQIGLDMICLCVCHAITTLFDHHAGFCMQDPNC